MNNNNTPRTPTLVESMLPILAMVLLLGVGYAAFDLPPEPLMVLSTVIARSLNFDQRGPTDWDMDDRRYYSADDLLRP